MANFVDGDIVDNMNDYELLLFSGHTIMKGNALMEMSKMTGAAPRLATLFPNLPGLIGGQVLQAKEQYQERHTLGLAGVRVDSGVIIAPLFYRRHMHDPIDMFLLGQHLVTVFKEVLTIYSMAQTHYRTAIELPPDEEVNKKITTLLGYMPNIVEVYKHG